MFGALINAPAKQSQSTIEYIIWKYLINMHDTKANEIIILSLVHDNKTFDDMALSYDDFNYEI